MSSNTRINIDAIAALLVVFLNNTENGMMNKDQTEKFLMNFHNRSQSNEIEVSLQALKDVC